MPTIGRPSLDALLDALARQCHDLDGRIVLVDDRRARGRDGSLHERVPQAIAGRTTVVASGGRGPAAARNCGWRACTAPWVAFVDDDVVPSQGWARQLAHDLGRVGDDVAAVQGRIVVPLPAERRPTDRERNVARLADAAWITADLAVRRAVLGDVDGFDERFARAYREDTDLHLRVVAAGGRFEVGERMALHPVTPAPWWASIAAQRGNADDALLRAIHGPGVLSGGRRPRHLLVTAAAAGGLLAGATGRRRLACLMLAGWLLGTAELTWARIRPGPRTGPEVATMALTSVAIPPAASLFWVLGRLRWHRDAR